MLLFVLMLSLLLAYRTLYYDLCCMLEASVGPFLFLFQINKVNFCSQLPVTSIHCE